MQQCTRLNEVRAGRPEQWHSHRKNQGIEEVVSMKSGLEDRNNKNDLSALGCRQDRVSMKSGLEDRNNLLNNRVNLVVITQCLNEVRPGRPEQFGAGFTTAWSAVGVSMKSGLEDRNNRPSRQAHTQKNARLNEVRPGRPEQ